MSATVATAPDPASMALRAPEIGTVVPPLAPGAYLVLRRRAAGLGRDDVALCLAATPGDRTDRSDLGDRPRILENEPSGWESVDIDFLGRLRAIYRFDLGVVLALAAAAFDPADPCPAPRICTRCGCSFLDACPPPRTDPGGLLCAWRDGPGDVCTACPAPYDPPAPPETRDAA